MKKNIKVIAFVIFCIILLLNYILTKTGIGFRTLPNNRSFLNVFKKDIILEVGETYKIKTFAINKRISYRSTDFKVAYVNLNGKVFARKPGVTYINVKVGKEKLKCRVQALKISRKKLLLSTSETYQLKIYGDGVLSLNSWKSSNKSVATVNRFGMITSKRAGTTVISCKVKGKTLSCKVKVEQ